MEIQPFNLQKVILGRSYKKHISIIIGMQVKRSHKFHWPAAPVKLPRNIGSMDRTGPLRSPGVSSKALLWKITMGGGFCWKIHPTTAGNWWKLMEFDGFIGASEVGFVHNSFNILQYQNWLMRHWLKPWSQQCWHWWWFQHVSTRFGQKIGYLTNDGYFTNSFTGSFFCCTQPGHLLLAIRCCLVPRLRYLGHQDCLQAAQFGCFPAQTVIENSNSSFPHNYSIIIQQYIYIYIL